MPSLRVLVNAQREDQARALCETVTTLLPSAAATVVDAHVIMEGQLPVGDAALIDIGDGGRASIDVFRALRARGFSGRVVILAESPHDETLRRTVTTLGDSACLGRGDVVEQPLRLAEELVAEKAPELMASPDPRNRGEHAAPVRRDSPAKTELARTRRAIAAGELALGHQHAINNPLAALLAEIQLFQLEELTAEQRVATERMVELCRRVVALVRRLDALADEAKV